jgi:flagellar protein FlaG
MYFLERAKGVAMQSTMISPSTQPMASAALTPVTVSSTSKTEIKNVEQIEMRKKVEENKELVKPEEISQEFNTMSKDLNLDVKFAYNAKIDTVYINVTDKNTGEIIKKLPTEEAMKIKESMKDLVGVLFDKKG